jgi:REP element-mobilizing transposase RayT
MTSHVHLIISSSGQPLNDIVRDFKQYTSKELIRAIKEGPESRRVWLLRKFHYAGGRIKRNSHYKVWKDGFHPVELNTNEMMDQRLEYVHQNPVKEGIVWEARAYTYSSAAYYEGGESILDISMLA